MKKFVESYKEIVCEPVMESRAQIEGVTAVVMKYLTLVITFFGMGCVGAVYTVRFIGLKGKNLFHALSNEVNTSIAEHETRVKRLQDTASEASEAASSAAEPQKEVVQA